MKGEGVVVATDELTGDVALRFEARSPDVSADFDLAREATGSGKELRAQTHTLSGHWEALLMQVRPAVTCHRRQVAAQCAQELTHDQHNLCANQGAMRLSCVKMTLFCVRARHPGCARDAVPAEESLRH